MHPELFRLGPFALKSYGLMLAVSFFLGTWLAVHRARRAGVPERRMIDLCFLLMIAGIVGSRFFYVVYHLEEFRGHWLDMINPVQSSGEVGIGGLSMMGGLLLAVIAAMAYFILQRTSPWPYMDAIAPSFFLGEGFTRIGCFLNGCCFGKPTSCWCGIVFPHDSIAGSVFPGVPLYPTQLISSVAGFVMAGALLLIEKKKKSFVGFTFWVGMILYSVFRFLIDFIRYYEDSMIFLAIGKLSISRNQFICLALIAISIWWLAYLGKRNAKREATLGAKTGLRDR